MTLKAPRIAVAADDNVAHTSFGGVWHLLDRAGVRFTSVRLRRLRGAAELARFNVIVLPDGGGYLGTLGKEGAADLKEWVERGNVLIGLGGGGTWFADKDAGLTTSRPVGAVEEEEGGEDGDGEPEEEPGPSGGKPSQADGPPARKAKKPVPLPGALFRARIDPEHFLGFGYPEGALAVPLSGDTFLTRSRTGANVITFGRTGPARLSGFVWPDNTEPLLANTAYVVDEPHGRGHALLFLEDPTSRALWPGLRRLFLSGLLFGPRDAPFLPTERE